MSHCFRFAAETRGGVHTSGKSQTRSVIAEFKHSHWAMRLLAMVPVLPSWQHEENVQTERNSRRSRIRKHLSHWEQVYNVGLTADEFFRTLSNLQLQAYCLTSKMRLVLSLIQITAFITSISARSLNNLERRVEVDPCNDQLLNDSCNGEKFPSKCCPGTNGFVLCDRNRNQISFYSM